MSGHRGWRTWMGTALLVGLASLTAARADAGTRVYVRIGPPAPIVEARPAAVRGQVWVGGYHHWNGHAYVWTPGRWTAPPRGRSVWVAPRWVHDRRHGWYFVAGHWR